MKFLSKILPLLILFFLSNTVQAETSSQENNKTQVINFYNAAFNQKDFAVASQYLSSHYIQHNPKVADGPLGLKDYIQTISKTHPQAHSEIKRVFVDNNYVILQVHSIPEPNSPGYNIIDIFRLENGKIIEHWDAAEPIPTNSKNSNGIF